MTFKGSKTQLNLTSSFHVKHEVKRAKKGCLRGEGFSPFVTINDTNVIHLLTKELYSYFSYIRLVTDKFLLESVVYL